MLNPAYTAIKAVNPAIQVAMSGPANDAGPCSPFLSGVISNGGNFDIATFHNYVGNPLGEAQSYRNITSKPIWLGEYGAQSATSDQSGLITSTLTGSAPLAMAQWYNLRDTGAWNCCPPALVSQASWGLLRADYSAKPSFGVMQSLLVGSAAYSVGATPSSWTSYQTQTYSIT